MAVTAAARKYTVRASDRVIINGYEVDGAILKQLFDAKPRVLWAFLQSKDGKRIQAVAYNEEHVIWLTDEDLERSKVDI